MLLPEAQSEASRLGLPLPELTIKLKLGLWARRAPWGQLAYGDVEHELRGQGIPTHLSQHFRRFPGLDASSSLLGQRAENQQEAEQVSST